MSRATSLADFDRSRDEFLAAMEEAPNAALTYLKKGDIYALGGLAVHVNHFLRHYRRVLEKLSAEPPKPFHAEEPPEETLDTSRRALAGLTPRERESEFRTLATRHGDVVRAALALPEEQWERKVDVTYGNSKKPLPTSAADVIGWITGHYREHVPQAAELLAEWRATQPN